MKGLSRKDARRLAYANVRLEGFRISDEFKEVYDDFANNKISQLDALERLGINVEGAPKHIKIESSKIYMSDVNKHLAVRR